MPKFNGDITLRDYGGSSELSLLGALSSGAIETYAINGDVSGIGTPESYYQSVSGGSWFLGGSAGFAEKTYTDAMGTWTTTATAASVLDWADTRLEDGGRVMFIEAVALNISYRNGWLGSFSAGGAFAGAKSNPRSITYTTDGDYLFCAFADGEVQRSTNGGTTWGAVVRSPTGTLINRCLFTRRDEKVLLFTTDDVLRYDGGSTWTALGTPWSALQNAAYNPTLNSFLVNANGNLYLSWDGGISWTEIFQPSGYNWVNLNTLGGMASVGSGWVIWDRSADKLVYFLNDDLDTWLALPFESGSTVSSGNRLGSNGRQFVYVGHDGNACLSASVGRVAARIL